ncbi:uncharacterized protein JCM6883_002770 [Sporobolomyces salmoneus]|uniref:uncharacterized protein n=1 Tax=Sporobolomyces salmoneus TaxID=183962 RepID=UPI00316DC530
MASAVIRAMSFGALSSSSSSDDHRGRGEREGSSSRSSSKNRYSRTLSRESTLELDDSLGLERSLSRLSLVSSATSGAKGGILISSRSRPSSPNPPTNRSLSHDTDQSNLSTSVGSSSSGGRTGRPLPPIRTHSSTSTAPSTNDPLTPSSPGFSGPPTVLPSSAVREESVERKKPTIKFAPLPQIRPRSYSTGRNVWAEHDDSTGGNDEMGGEFALAEDESGSFGGRHLVRREDGSRIPYDENGLDDEEDDEDDYDSQEEEEGGGFKFNPRRQSWTDSLGMGSVWLLNSSGSGHKRDKSREVDADAVSLGSSAGNGSDHGLSSSGGKEKESSGGVSKILKPFLFGRKKSLKSSSRSSATTSTNVDENGGAGLSRQSSRESQVSRKSSSNDTTPEALTPLNQEPRPKGTTGIPMRKASTWDSTNSTGSKGSNASPSKKKKNRQSLVPTTSPLPRDPSTPQIIYYASPNRSTRPARRAQYPPVAQRSRTAPKPIRQTKVEEPEFSEWGSVGSVGSVGSRGSGGKSGVDEDEDGSGMAWIRRRRKEREEKEKRDRELALAQASMTAEPEEEEEEVQSNEKEPEDEVVKRAISQSPKRQSTVDSTFSVTSSASTIRPSTPKIMSGLSLSRPAEADGAVPTSHVAEPESEDEDNSEVEGSEDEREDDDDLDEEELAQEEALAEAARRTAKGAGAERYHSTTHENVLHVPNDSPAR